MKTYKIQFSITATRSLSDIYYYIAVVNKSPENAEKHLNEIKKNIEEMLSIFPKAGKKILKDRENVRCLIYQKYLIIYSYDDENVYIREIKSGRQNR